MIDSILSQNTFQKIYKKIPKNSFENSAHDFEHSLRVAKNAIEI